MFKRFLGPVLALTGMLAAGALAVAAPGGDVFTDPETAPADFKIQGEYAGTAGSEKLGAQVIAQGNNTYQAVFLAGGLPGAGWDKSPRIRVNGKSEGETVLFAADTGWSGAIADGGFTGKTDKGVSFNLKRVERKSPTLEMKPPAGAIVLFDGTNADAWQGGQMSPEGLLKVGTRSKRDFQSFTIHFEFRTPFQPTARGQGRGNSGLFLQDRYEVQILDSFGLDGKDNECGGLYSQKAPDVNMCLPPLSWQTYDIDFQTAQFDDAGNKAKPAVVTVRHNGVVIHERFELPGPGPVGKKEDKTGGTFQIQNHGNPVVVRNVWVVER